MAPYNERTQFIEETGLLFEQFGLTRMAGRILGYLMVSDKEMVSFDELTQVLQASKSSISSNLKSLTAVSFIKPVSQPGDRKTYYMLYPDMSWPNMLLKRMEELRILSQLFDKAINLRANKTDRSSKWLLNAHDFYEWLIGEFKSVIQKWDNK